MAALAGFSPRLRVVRSIFGEPCSQTFAVSALCPKGSITRVMYSIHQNSSIAFPTCRAKFDRSGRIGGQGHDPMEKSGGRGWQSTSCVKMHADFSTGSYASNFQGLMEVNRDTRPGFDKGQAPFGKNLAGTVKRVAEKRAHMQYQLLAYGRSAPTRMAWLWCRSASARSALVGRVLEGAGETEWYLAGYRSLGPGCASRWGDWTAPPTQAAYAAISGGRLPLPIQPSILLCPAGDMERQ